MLPAQAAKAPACASAARHVSGCSGSACDATPVPELDSKQQYDLPTLIDMAESLSPETCIAWATAKRSLEQAGIARAEYLPVMAFVAHGGDSRSIVPFPKPIAPRGYVIAEIPEIVVQAELEYKLLDFGRPARVDAAKLAAQASSLRMTRTQQQVAFNTARGFYRVQETEGQLAAAKQILNTAQTLQANAQMQFDNGRATLPDVQNADAGAAEAQFDLANAEGEVKKAKLALTEAIGVEPTTEIEVVAAEKTRPEEFRANVDEMLQQAWKSRPDLLAREDEFKRAKDSVKNARSRYLPTVSMAAVVGQTNMDPTADYGYLGPASVTTWSAQGQLRWEIFNGARGHELQAAKAEQKAAAEEKRAAEDSVTRQVWEAYVDLQTALEQQRAAQTFLTSSQTSYDSSLDAFRYGVRSLVDVVQAEKLLAQARLASVKAEARTLQSRAALSYALGAMPATATSNGVRP